MCTVPGGYQHAFLIFDQQPDFNMHVRLWQKTVCACQVSLWLIWTVWDWQPCSFLWPVYINCELRSASLWRVTCVGNFSPAMGAWNQVGIGLSYRPASLCSLATQFQTRFLELIPCHIAGLNFSTLFTCLKPVRMRLECWWAMYRCLPPWPGVWRTPHPELKSMEYCSITSIWYTVICFHRRYWN
jgi:hypothetical protein